MGRIELFFFLIIFQFSDKSFGQDLAPQLWTNFSVAGFFNENLVGNMEVSYNTILDKEFKWREFAATPAVDYRFHKHFSVNGAFTYSWVNQSKDLYSSELRPSLGIRINFLESKRYNVFNLTRLQLRYLSYSDGTSNLTGRLRNLTTFVYSLNKNNLLERSNWLFQLGVEIFINFEDDVRERFFNLFRARTGFTYRFQQHANIGLNVLYQEARDNVEEGPTLLPVTPPDTRFIIELNFVYLFPGRED